MDLLVSFASDEGLEFNEGDWSISEGHISLLFKSYLARDLWGMEYFYEVFNNSDEVFIKELIAKLDSDNLIIGNILF